MICIGRLALEIFERVDKERIETAEREAFCDIQCLGENIGKEL
jgi:hypothetical protein